jgi:hypothetical protein
MASSPDQLLVEVIYARADVQEPITVLVPKGATVRAAIERSRIAETYPEIDLALNKVGIYGELRSLNDTLQANDRVEIYRPLLVDPKEARRANAKLNAESGSQRRLK